MAKFQFQSISFIPSFVEAFLAASPRSGQLLKRRDLYLRGVQCIAMSPPCRSYSLHNRGTCLPRDFRLSWCCWRNYILEAEQHQPLVDWGALALLFNCHHHSGVEAVVHAVFEVPLLQKHKTGLNLDNSSHFRTRVLSILASDTICENKTAIHMLEDKKPTLLKYLRSNSNLSLLSWNWY